MILTQKELKTIIVTFIIMTPLAVLKCKLLNKTVCFKEILIGTAIILIYKILSDRILKKI